MLPIDGDWDVLLHEGLRCCPKGLSVTDMILVCIQTTRRGTLRLLLYVISFGKYKRLKGATAYIVRINRQGQLRMARPCDECMEELRSAGIRKIRYSTNEGE